MVCMSIRFMAAIAVTVLSETCSAAPIEVVEPSSAAEASIRKLAPKITIEKWFKGPGNLLGVAARVGEEPLVFFTDPEGAYMISGAVINIHSGENMLAQATTQFFGSKAVASTTASPLPSPETSKLSLNDMKGLKWVSQGKAVSGNVAYIIIDFACGHCVNLYKAISQKPIKGEIRWVPVTLSGEVATTKAALALGTGDIGRYVSIASDDLIADVSSKKKALMTGALAAESNTKLIASINITSTPHFIYQSGTARLEHSGYASTSNILDALGVR